MYTSLKNLLLTALAPIIWGSTYIITSEVLPDNMPLTAAAARALPAGILLLALFGKLPSGGWWTRLMLLGVLNIGGFFYFLFLTAYLLPGGIAALVMSCQPLIVMALGTQLLGTTYDRNQLLATVIGMVGITLLLIHSTIELNTLGVLAGLTGTSVMALGVVLTKKWGRPDGMGILSFTGWQLTFGGLFLAPIALFCEGLPQSLTTTHLLGYGYLSLVGTALCYLLWFRGIEKLPVITTSFLGFLTSLSACLLGFFVLNQALSKMQLVGGLAIVSAIFLSTAKPRASRPLAISSQSELTGTRQDLC